MMSKKAARLVLIPLVVLAFAALLGRALLEVSRGNGAGTYESFYGMTIHWISVLSLAAAIAAAFLIALGLRWWQRRDDRAIDSALAGATKTSDNRDPP
jgi:hypothetical protein